MADARFLYLAHFYPPAPQRFLADEVIRWRKGGLEIDVLAIKRPDATKLNLMSAEVLGELPHTTFLADLGIEAWIQGILACLRRPIAASSALLRVWTGRYPRINSVRLRAHAILTSFRVVPVLGYVIRRDFRHIHCDFSDDTATIAWVINRVSGIPFSFRDYFSFNPQLAVEKLRASRFTLACSQRNRAALLQFAPDIDPDKVMTSYLGVDLSDWVPCKRPTQPSIVAIGTLQEKKGHIYLVRAMALLRERQAGVKCYLIGDGELRDEIAAEIAQLRLRDLVEITGYLPKDRVREMMCSARVVAVPSVIASNGDTDGVPFVLMEAMAMGKPCISTAVGGIDEVITHGEDGLLVPQKDPSALADALFRLLKDVELAETMGRAARAKAEAQLDIDRNTADTAALLHRELAKLAR